MEEQNTQQSQPQQPAANQQKKEKNTAMAIIAYIIFFIPLLTDAKKDPFVKYHVKQGLVLFICSILVGIVAKIFVLSIIGTIIVPLLNLGLLILLIIGIINATNGVEKPLPFIGQFAGQFKF